MGIEDIGSNLEGLSGINERNATSLEVSDTQMSYLQELNVSSEDWEGMSSMMKDTVISRINDRLEEMGISNNNLINETVQKSFSPEIVEAYNAKYETTLEINSSVISHCPIEGSNGHWDGERGFSKWIPDETCVPQRNNPEELSWKEINNKFEIDDGITFHEGEPDFSEISKNTLTLDEPEYDRGIVFNEADIKAAELRGCTPEEVRAWRKENQYTWHECRDGVTVQKVPSIVHGNITHLGGHSINSNLAK